MFKYLHELKELVIRIFIKRFFLWLFSFAKRNEILYLQELK